MNGKSETIHETDGILSIRIGSSRTRVHQSFDLPRARPALPWFLLSLGGLLTGFRRRVHPSGPRRQNHTAAIPLPETPVAPRGRRHSFADREWGIKVLPDPR